MPDAHPAPGTDAGATAASGTVHWIGTGLSTGSGLAAVCDAADHVVLWARSTEKAERKLADLGLAGRAGTEIYDPAALHAVLKPGDIVVSMLPASAHAGLLEMCIAEGAHFACTSYTSEAIADAAPLAANAGVVALTEAGLDPGIDHLLAHKLVAQAREAAGEGPATATFTSYCGGIPAEPNDFKYRFSWAPRGVLSALREPARYIGDGAEQVAEHPWEVVRPHQLGGETFEVYPNRDSLPFLSQYEFPAGWAVQEFVRGTLRLDGWSAAWTDVFAELLAGDDARITELATELAARYPVTDADHDRVVLAVALSVQPDAVQPEAVQPDGGAPWSGSYVIDLTGDDTETAMAKCVSLPLAFGITEILSGQLAPGLHRAASTDTGADRWLAFLAERGIPATFTAP